MIGQKPEGRKCASHGWIAAGMQEHHRETEEHTMTRDAALIIAAQKIEHYEIASYGGLVALAVTLGLERAADILDKTLMEEEGADNMLTDIAETYSM